MRHDSRVHLMAFLVHRSSRFTLDELLRRAAPIVEGDNKRSVLHRAQDDFKAKNFIDKPAAVPESKWREAAV